MYDWCWQDGKYYKEGLETDSLFSVFMDAVKSVTVDQGSLPILVWDGSDLR